MDQAEPRWDRDLLYGKQGELLIDDYLTWIAKGNGRVETKRKRRLDLEFYVETECDKGRTGNYQPSGINGTTSDLWVYVLGDSKIALCLPTELLRAAMKHSSVRSVSENDGACPTRGVLVNIGAMFAVARSNGNGNGQ